MKPYCYKCSSELECSANTTISRSAECDSCHSSVRVCRNCNFYDPQKNNECSEPQADRVVDKEKSNFCDYFSLKFSDTKPLSKHKSKDKVLDELESLFKK